VHDKEREREREIGRSRRRRRMKGQGLQGGERKGQMKVSGGMSEIVGD
jgi:hypothetical protein